MNGMIQTENHGTVSRGGVEGNILTATNQINRTQAELDGFNSELPDLDTALGLATADLIDPTGAVNEAQTNLDEAEGDDITIAQTALDEANAILEPFQTAYDEANQNYTSKQGEITGSESRLVGYNESKTLWESYL